MSQPVEVYPNSVIRQPDSSHSNGSFGPVFIVLAVIVVISMVACVLGRLFNRRHDHPTEARHHHPKEANHHHHHPKEANHHHHHAHAANEANLHQHHPAKANNESHGLGPKEWESRQKPSITIRERRDVEFGFDKRIPSARVANINGGGVVKPPHYNGGHKPEVRFADNV